MFLYTNFYHKCSLERSQHIFKGRVMKRIYIVIVLLILIISLGACHASNIANIEENTYIISNDKVWVNVETDIEGKLNFVVVFDKHGRTILVNFDDNGIRDYQISDFLSGYYVDTDFSEQYFLNDRPVIPSVEETPPPYNQDIVIYPNAFLRTERIGQIEFKSIIDYSKEPYFFIISEKEKY